MVCACIDGKMPIRFDLNKFVLPEEVDRTDATHREESTEQRYEFTRERGERSLPELYKLIWARSQTQEGAFFHEIWRSEKIKRVIFCLDVDGKKKPEELLRTFVLQDFVYKTQRGLLRLGFEPSKLKLLIWKSAIAEPEFSYHFRWPDLVCTPAHWVHIHRALMHWARSEHWEDYERYADQQQVENKSLRMPWCDKWNKEEKCAEGRPLRYLHAYNAQRRLDENEVIADEENDPELPRELNLMMLSVVHRPSYAVPVSLPEAVLRSLPNRRVILAGHTPIRTPGSKADEFNYQKAMHIYNFTPPPGQTNEEALGHYMGKYFFKVCGSGQTIYGVRSWADDGTLRIDWPTSLQELRNGMSEYNFVRTFYDEEKCKVVRKTVNMFDWFNTNVLCDRYKRIVFEADLSRVLPTDCNRYTGIPATEEACDRAFELSGCHTLEEVAQTKLKRILDFTLYDICGGDQRVHERLLDLLSLKLHEPGRRMDQAIVLHGGTRKGKNCFVDHYSMLFGQYAHTMKGKKPGDRFNMDEAEKLVLVMDEAMYNSKQYDGTLKTMITSEDIDVEEKYKATRKVRNQRFMWILSNEEDPIPLPDLMTFRYFMLWIENDHTAEYWQALYHYFTKHVFLWGWYLRNRHYSAVLQRDVYMTQAQVSAVIRNQQLRRPVWYWLYTCAKDGHLGINEDTIGQQQPRPGDVLAIEENLRVIPWPSGAENALSKQTMFKLFRQATERVEKITGQHAFFMEIAAIFRGAEGFNADVRSASTQQGRLCKYTFPELSLTRKLFERSLGIPEDRPDLDIWTYSQKRARAPETDEAERPASRQRMELDDGGPPPTPFSPYTDPDEESSQSEETEPLY